MIALLILQNLITHDSLCQVSINSGYLSRKMQHKEASKLLRDITSIFLGDQTNSIFHKVSKTCITEVPLRICQIQAPAGVHRQYKGLRHKLLPFPLSSPGCLPASSQAPDGTGRNITPCPPPPHARGHSTKSHAVPQSSHCISPWPLCFDQCIHYSLGKVCKDPAQHPEA